MPEYSDYPSFCPWCDGEVDAIFVMGVPGPATPFCCMDCCAVEMNNHERKTCGTAEERAVGWYRPEPEYCPHVWKDEGLMKPEYVCEYCLSKMEDFK